MSYQKVLTYESIPQTYKNAKYGCKGALTQKAQTYEKELDQGKDLQFEKITKLYEGNPQQLGQPPLTFLRQVLACIVDPALMEEKIYHQDVVARAKKYFDSFPSIGVYPDTQGYMDVRENIAKYIQNRDGGFPCDQNFIFVTCGSVGAIRFIVKLLIAEKNVDGVMIPVPSHPMFASTIALEGGKSVGYSLNEANNWQIDINDLEASYEKATKEGTKIKGIVVINPNNPTGSILSEANMKEVINFCIKHTVVLFADEVYQENVYSEEQKLHSFKKVLMSMGAPANQQLELISSNSISKGISGEGGFRGGYMELLNIEEEIVGQLQKLDAMVDPANGIGQVAIDLIVDPPSKENGCSQEIIDEYTKEKEEIQKSLTTRAKNMVKCLNECKNIKSTEILGSLYAFPQVQLSESAQKAAQAKQMTPDEFYCHECLDQTGIAILPGKCFGQKEDTYHFRISILQYDPSEMEKTMNHFKAFNDGFHAKYA